MISDRIQIFPLPDSITLPSHAVPSMIPNDVAVLGDVNIWGRLNYTRLWTDLVLAIQGKISRPGT